MPEGAEIVRVSAPATGACPISAFIRTAGCASLPPGPTRSRGERWWFGSSSCRCGPCRRSGGAPMHGAPRDPSRDDGLGSIQDGAHGRRPSHARGHFAIFRDHSRPSTDRQRRFPQSPRRRPREPPLTSSSLSSSIPDSCLLTLTKGAGSICIPAAERAPTASCRLGSPTLRFGHVRARAVADVKRS